MRTLPRPCHVFGYCLKPNSPTRDRANGRVPSARCQTSPVLRQSLTVLAAALLLGLLFGNGGTWAKGGGGHGRGHRGARAGGGHHGGGHHGHGNRHRHGGGGSNFFLGVTPGGIGYGYRSGGFGLYVAPSYGYRQGAYHYPVRTHHQAVTVRATPYESLPDQYLDRPQRDAAPPHDAPSISAPLIPTTRAAERYQASAERALRAADYESAVQLSVRAVAEDPGNGKLRLFQSVAFFAYGDYQSSADALRRGLTALEEPDWGEVVWNRESFYDDDEEYRSQRDRLARSARRNPTRSDMQLLAGYHYLYSSAPETARGFLDEMLTLDPKDPLAPTLLELAAESLPAPRAPP